MCRVQGVGSILVPRTTHTSDIMIVSTPSSHSKPNAFNALGISSLWKQPQEFSFQTWSLSLGEFRGTCKVKYSGRLTLRLQIAHCRSRSDALGPSVGIIYRHEALG